MRLLDRIDVHGGGGEVLARVQPAVLKLSEGDRDQIAGLVEMASTDDRDALVGAEYPEQMRWEFANLADLDSAERKAHRQAVKRGRENYLALLEKPGV